MNLSLILYIYLYLPGTVIRIINEDGIWIVLTSGVRHRRGHTSDDAGHADVGLGFLGLRNADCRATYFCRI